MSIFWIIILAIVMGIIGFIVYRMIAFNKAKRMMAQIKFKRIKPLYDKLESGESVTKELVFDYAKDLLTRVSTYDLLRARNLDNLFPGEYYTIQKAGESNLANWLEFPTELDACPDEIEHVKEVIIDFDGQSNFVHYHVYKFRVNEPHWAAKDGWMVGVVGPYFDDSKPYDHPHCTFSRLSSKFETTSPDEEAKWVHEKISLRRR